MLSNSHTGFTLSKKETSFSTNDGIEPKTLDESSVTYTQYPDYMQAVKPSCSNCQFWDSEGDGLYKQCGRIKNDFGVDETFDTEKDPAFIMDSIIYTSADFSCSLHELKAEG